MLEGYRKEATDVEVIPALGEQGFIGASFTGYDLPGISKTASGLICREIERIDSGYRSMYSVQNSLALKGIHAFAPEPLKRELIPGLVAGKLVGCFGLTEPDHGSDPAGMETVAVSDGAGGYLLSGSKTWISNSPIADVFLVFAKDKTSGDRIQGFVLRKGMEGLSAPKIEGKLSLRASVTGMIVMDGVRVPAANKFEKHGIATAFGCLNEARFGICWGALGAAERCYEIALDYLMTRKQFGRPLASFQLVQAQLAEIATELSLATQAVLRMSRLEEAGELPIAVISMMKKNSCKVALDVARTVRQLLGANGIVDEFEVMRHVANLETVITYEGAYDIHNLILGRAITGIQAFS